MHFGYLFIYFIMKCSICDLSVPNGTENYYVCVIYVVYLNYCNFLWENQYYFWTDNRLLIFLKIKIFKTNKHVM